MISIADISCDINVRRLELILQQALSKWEQGSLEFMDHSTSIEDPFFIYDPIAKKNHKKYVNEIHERYNVKTRFSMEGRGVLILSVENLPAELPLEASTHFGKALLPHAVELVTIVHSVIPLPLNQWLL
jgi:alpha-aminoadipic semialdehyde synthase